MSQRFEGRNIEEALQSAAQTLGVERYRLTYHVLVEKRGFLGGVKRVVIEAEVNENAETPALPAPRMDAAPAPPAARPAAHSSDRPRGRRDDDSERRGRRRDRRRRGERRDAEAPRSRDEGSAWVVPEEIPAQAEESPAAASVRAWCEEALRLARLECEIRTGENDTQIVVRIYGRDAHRLLEHHGEVLDALQVLANKALVGRRVEKDVELDCSAFKERRVEELNERARAIADRVRRDGHEQLLPAMSPIERRIVHLALHDDADVTTESRGEGFYKRVAIVPRPHPASSES